MLTGRMKIIGLVPVRNEAWVLPHSLASLSGFCDVVIVSDQSSDDRSREICRAFPKVVAARVRRMPDQHAGAMAAARCGARLRRLQPAVVHRCRRARRAAPGPGRSSNARDDASMPGTVIECMLPPPLATAPAAIASMDWRYGPHLKQLALVDDRRMDYDRSRPLLDPRAARSAGRRGGDAAARPTCGCFTCSGCSPSAPRCGRRGYRCREWLDGKAAAAINETYAGTLPDPASAPRRCRPRGPKGSRFRTWPSTASRRGTSATSSAGSTSGRPSSSSRWKSGTSRCSATAFEQRRRPAAAARPFLPAVLAGARAALREAPARRRRGGGCPCDMARPFPHRPDGTDSRRHGAA